MKLPSNRKLSRPPNPRLTSLLLLPFLLRREFRKWIFPTNGAPCFRKRRPRLLPLQKFRLRRVRQQPPRTAPLNLKFPSSSMNRLQRRLRWKICPLNSRLPPLRCLLIRKTSRLPFPSMKLRPLRKPSQNLRNPLRRRPLQHRSLNSNWNRTTNSSSLRSRSSLPSNRDRRNRRQSQQNPLRHFLLINSWPIWSAKSTNSALTNSLPLPPSPELPLPLRRLGLQFSRHHPSRWQHHRLRSTRKPDR